MEELQNAGFRIVNVDTTLIMNAPKIAPIAGDMRSSVADLLGIEMEQVSIKAKTPEGLGLDHVAQCHAVVLVERSIEPDELKSMSAVIESQKQLEDVVDDLLASVHGVPKKRTINPGLRHRRHHIGDTPRGNRGKILSTQFLNESICIAGTRLRRVFSRNTLGPENEQTSVGGATSQMRVLGLSVTSKKISMLVVALCLGTMVNPLRAETAPAAQFDGCSAGHIIRSYFPLGRASCSWIFQR